MRLELVHRRDVAKAAAEVWIKSGPQEAADRAAASYQFEHEIYKDLGATPIQAHRPETELGTTLRWFLVQVVPAIRKMIDKEVITLEDVNNAILGNEKRGH